VVVTALLIGYFLRIEFADTRLVRAAPHYIGLFAVGMLGAHLARSADPLYVHLRERVRWEVVAIAAFIVVGVLCRIWGWALAVRRFDYLDFPICIFAVALLVHASSSAGRATARSLAWRPLAFIGTFSYSLYLIHAPLLQILWQYVMQPAHLGFVSSFFFLMGPGALLILCVSYGFFKLFEEPFMRQAKPKSVVPAGQPAAPFVA
jgi:peptidoglycan/LPS O-acetylase OafA/YrhL